MVRRRLRAGLLGLVGVVCVVVATAMIMGDSGADNALATVVGTFVGLASLAAGLVTLVPPAGPPPDAEALAADLARTIRAEWLDEVGSRKLRDPKVLPVTWSCGRVDGPFDEAARRLAAEFRRIRTGRLVVLGEPGSGKTVLAMLLTLGLIADRAPDAPVPVLLSVSSWDPVRASLDDWIVQTLAGAYYNGRTDIPRLLLTHGLVLPVLDGVDEIPEVARRHAVHRINAAVGTERPVVVTCRSAEYDDLIEAGSPTLRQSPVQRVSPLSVDDVITHLAAVPDWPGSWTPVYAELRRAPDGPVAAALSTPLMISLTVSVYRQGGDPAELLDTTRFPSRHAVEDHLVDRAIDAAYEFDSGRERAWLAYLARHLHDHRERDLAWWRLADRLVSPWVAPVLGVAFGLATVVLLGGAAAMASSTRPEVAFGYAVAVGTVVALVATALWFGSAGRAPGRVGVVWQGSVRRLRRGFRTGAAFVLMPGVPIVVFGAISVLVIDDASFTSVRDVVMGVMVEAALLCVVGSAVAAHHWLDAIPERSARATPLGFLRRDRRAALVGAVVAGVVAAALTWPLLTAAMYVGEVFGLGLAGWTGMAGTADFWGPVELLGFDSTGQSVTWLVVMPFLTVTSLVLLTRAWPRFVLARTVLAATRRLPWRLLGFLADARDRGLLRQSGGVYQFRHVRLQQRLALPAEVIDNPGENEGTQDAPGAGVPRRRHRVGAVIAVGSLLATAVVALTTFNHLRCLPAFSMSTDVDRLRQLGEGQSCVGPVPEPEMTSLAAEYPAVARLREANAQARRGAVVAAFLPLGAARLSRRTLSIIDGITLAQRETMRLGRPTRVLLVNSGHDEAEFVAWERLDAVSSRTGMPIRAVVGARPDYYWRETGPANFGIPAEQSSREDPEWVLTPTMVEFVRSLLRPPATWQSTVVILDPHVDCAHANKLVTLHILTIESKPQTLDDLACDRNPIVATDDEHLAAHLLSLDAGPFRNLTLYYPVRRPNQARAFVEVARESGLSPGAPTAAPAYRALVNAAGFSDFAIHSLTATGGAWHQAVVRQ